MKRHATDRFDITVKSLLVASLFVLGTSRALAEVEISLDDEKPAQATPTPAPAKTMSQPEAKPAPSNPQAETTTEVAVEEEGTADGSVTMEEAETTQVKEVHGVLKMKDIYEAGIKSYKEKDYDQAIRYLKQAVDKKDKYTPKFYYAEAHAMLGVIYQFRIIRLKDARYHYQQALKYEPGNRTAKKHLREVNRKLRK